MHKTITWITLVFGMAVVLLIVRDTHAQIKRREPPSGFGWREGVPIQLVTKSSAVQKELGLSPDAVRKIAELQTQIAIESRLEPKEFSIELDKTLLGVLSDAQKKAFEDLKGEPFEHLQWLR